MKRFDFSPQTEARKYALAGMVFGLFFPVIATLIRITDTSLPFGLASIVLVQSTDPLLWIIDTAPVFLGLFAYFAGQRQDHLQSVNSELRQRERELEEIRRDLELGVEQRTQELATATRQTMRRADQLRLIAEVARSAISIQDVDRLLPHIARLISERFGFYHVGVFLLDEQRQYAVLQASNSPGGLKMIEKGHRLKVGAQGIVGHVAQSGQARIALNVENDRVYFASLDLPETRSEIALPLKSADSILGVLDIQSTEPNAFTQDDTAILSILADQMAIAIQNAISYKQSQRSLREAQLVSQQASGEAWAAYMAAFGRRGYRYDGVRSEPLKGSGNPSEKADAISVAVRLRGQTIGHLKLNHAEAGHQWTEDEIALAEATAERVALALEGARLLEEARRRAARETFLSDISAKLGASFQMDSILRDTVEELGQTLKHSIVTFQLVNPSGTLGTERFQSSPDRTDGEGLE